MTDLPLDWALLGDAPLAVAVSGGADSFALLHAVAERGLPVVALTVDHGLREGGAEDARVVAAWCEGRGVPHETLRWRGSKPETGVQAAARAARYRLLCEACERRGLDRLATGHTLDDQAETVFMRLRRGAGRGLAGMPPERKIASGPGEPVSLARPMLGVRRAEARAYAEAADLPVRDDPSNGDEGFERVRVRALLGALEEQGLLTAEALGRTAGRVSDLQASLNEHADYVLATLTVGSEALARSRRGELPPVGSTPLSSDVDGGFTLAEEDTTGNPLDALTIEAAFNALGTKDIRLPRDHVNNLADDGFETIGGVCLVNSVSGYQIYREPAALLGRADGTPGLAPVPAPPGSRHLYDRRFVAHVPDDADPGTELRPLGQLMPRDIATSTLARSRVSTLPCLASGERLTHLPAQAERAVHQALSGWKGADALLGDVRTFPARSLLAERFANEVIRY